MIGNLELDVDVEASATTKTRRRHSFIQFPRTTGFLAVATVTMIALAASGVDVCTSSPRRCLSAESYWAIWVVIATLALLVNEAPSDLTMLGATTVLLLTKVIEPKQAWQGFANDSVLSVGALYVLARALDETRAVEQLVAPMLGKPRTHAEAIVRLCVPVTLMSAILNNTPIVAILISIVETWAARSRLSARVLLMPLSFASLLGGSCTLIGTSSNLVLQGLLVEDQLNNATRPCEPFSTFTQAPIGIAMAIAGIALLALLAPVLLREAPPPSAAEGGSGEVGGGGAPSEVGGGGAGAGAVSATWSGEMRRTARQTFRLTLRSSHQAARSFTGAEEGVRDSGTAASVPLRNYRLYAVVGPGCELVGEKAATALDRISATDGANAAAIVAIVRSGQPAPLPWAETAEVTLEENDTLEIECLAGAVPLLRRLKRLRAAAEDTSAELGARRRHRVLLEAIAARGAGLERLSVDDAAAELLRRGAALWAVRGMRPVSASAVGAQRLPDGATLLLEAPAEFVDANPAAGSDLGGRGRGMFALASVVPNSTPPREGTAKDRARVAACLACLVVLLGGTSSGLAELLTLAVALGFFVVAIKCITVEQAWASVNVPCVLTIAASFGLAAALENTNVSVVIGDGVRALAIEAGHPLPFLLIVFVVTSALSCCVSNAATVVLLYSVLKEVQVPGLRGQQVMLALMTGASAGFATPISSSPNLMVFQAAPYAFADFVLLGTALTVLSGVVGCVAIWLVPEEWLPG